MKKIIFLSFYSLFCVSSYGRDFVDLGLPSGTLWATYNIGADNPEDFGDYFAWGDVTGYKEGKRDNVYNEENYIFHEHVVEDYVYNHGLNKYVREGDGDWYGYKGYTDGLTVLEPGDDAATVKWGVDWCMPSPEQVSELFDECICEHVYSDVQGLLFKSKKNGNSVFFPSAGIVGANGYQSYGFCYWTNSLADYGSAYASYMNSYGVDMTYRYKGYSIRAVRKGGSTGISKVNSVQQPSTTVYNIQGQRLAKPVPGINIINGKKYLR